MFFNLILVRQKLNGPTRRENEGFRGRIRTIAVISDSEESEAFSRKKILPRRHLVKKCSRRRWHHRTAFGEKISRRRWHPSPQFCGILISRLSRKSYQEFFFILRAEKELSHRINCDANRECVNVRTTHQSTRPQLSNLDSFFLPIVFQIVRTLRDR